MSHIRGKNTKPELLVYSHLRKNGIYFQKHYRSREGVRLDLALPRKKRGIFIDGDFWHGRTIDKVIERRGLEDFWTRKLLRNIERDKEQTEKLEAAGWTLLRVWESDLMKISSREFTLKTVVSFLTI